MCDKDDIPKERKNSFKKLFIRNINQQIKIYQLVRENFDSRIKRNLDKLYSVIVNIQICGDV